MSTGNSPEWGIFARTFPRPSAAEVAAEVASFGFTVAQFNLSSVGEPTIPEPDNVIDFAAIKDAFGAKGIRLWGLSCTYNTIHPDVALRQSTTAKAVEFIGKAPMLGASAVTLCTGTRDLTDIWRRHPDNDDPSAWRDLRETLDQLLPAAQAAGVQLGVEPEVGNVIRDARSAKRLLDELGPDSGLIGIVLDPANLLDMSTVENQGDILRAAFDLLGEHVVCMQAKDVVEPGGYSAAGMGKLDYDLVFELYAGLPTHVPIVIQDAVEDDVTRTRDFLVETAGRHL